MRAVVCEQGRLEVAEVPDPRPARGQLVLEVRRAGICGSDLHARHHADDLAAVMDDLDYDHSMRASTPVVMGHEFSGEVVDRGRGVPRGLTEGTHVVSFPLVRAQGGTHPIGLSPLAPGAYAERILVEGSLTYPVPGGLEPEVAALTEPMAVGLHAVRRGEVGARDVAVVLGCGPVGLAVICHLKAQGVRTVVASDPSAGRRALAEACGADVVVDPDEDSPWTAAGDRGWQTTAPGMLDFAVDSMDRLRRLPGWSRAYRLAERLGAADIKRPVVFECVGVPGMLDRVVRDVPFATRVVVVGVCMEPDRISPVMAINKEVELRFVLAYTPLELRDTLHMLADGTVDPRPMVTGTVGLDGVAGAFDTLASAERHAKVLVDPASAVTRL